MRPEEDDTTITEVVAERKKRTKIIPRKHITTIQKAYPISRDQVAQYHVLQVPFWRSAAIEDHTSPLRV